MLEEEEERKEGMRMGKQEDREIEMLLNEIPRATSPHLYHHRLFACGGDGDMHARHGMCLGIRDVDGYGCWCGSGHGHGHGGGHACLLPPPHPPSEGSSSSSSGSGLLSGRLSPTVDEQTQQRLPSAAKDRMLVELGLLDKLNDIHLGTDPRAPNGLPPMPASMEENIPTYPSLFQTKYRDDYSAYGHSLNPNPLLFDVDKNRYLSQLQQHCPVEANLVEPWLESFPYGSTGLGADGALGRDSHYRGSFAGGLASSMNRSYPISDIFMQSGKIRMDCNWDGNALAASRLPHNFLVSNGRPQSVRIQRNIEAVGSEGSLVIQDKLPHHMRNQWNHLLRENKVSKFDEELNAQRIPVKLPTFPLKYDNLMGFKGRTYYIAKDQHGCRSLQRKLDEGKHQVDMIFDGVIEHVVELMMDPFGNYLMQKLLEVCSEEQLMQILFVLKEDPTNLVRISLNIHGTRSVQKLIETLKTRQQIALVISAMQHGILDLIKDLNGSHVLQRCLESFKPEDNKFIFDAAAKHCVDIATHRHGCCVLQKCIASSIGEDKAKLVSEISANGYELARDPFGNYVVQYIVDLNNPLASAKLVSQFEGKYVQLSVQKFSSNVVEKCLRVFGEDARATIITELLSVSHFEQLLQDPYANYVIRSALENSKGSLYAALEEAILPHEVMLRTNPYSKRIFSRLRLKK
ncbi:unnamed protein product [Musa banksii]